MRAIDADELLTAFPVDDEPTLTKSCVRMTIKHMATIEPRKKGVWINDCCSICGYGIEPWNNTPYCPNCGADMRGDSDA